MQLAISQIRTDGDTQPRAGVNEWTIRDYAMDMLEGDQFPPIVVFHDGDSYWLSAGFHRVAAAIHIGRAEIEASVRDGGPREAFLYAVEDNRRNGVRYTTADKQAMIDRFLEDTEWTQWNNSKISRLCGVDHKTVASRRSILGISQDGVLVERNGTTYEMNTTGIGRRSEHQWYESTCPECGRKFPGNGGREICYPCIQKQRPDLYGTQTNSEWRDRFLRGNEELGLANIVDAETGELIDIIPTRSQHTMQVMGSSESPEWYTPTYVVDLVVSLFDVISVDPCSNSHETPNVPAETLYTKADDGLSQPWRGNIYMNPPYGDEIGPWIERMVSLYRAGEIDQAVALLPGRIDTQWFQPLYDYPICNVRGRIKFQNADNSAPFPSVIVYLGADQDGFIETFKHLGPIVKRIA